MNVLLDENLPQDVRHLLSGHDVATVGYLGWKGVDNGELLRRAAAAGFDVVLTKDAAIENEHPRDKLPIAVIVIRARTNAIDDIRPHIPAVLLALHSLQPRTLVRIPD